MFQNDFLFENNKKYCLTNTHLEKKLKIKSKGPNSEIRMLKQKEEKYSK